MILGGVDNKYADSEWNYFPLVAENYWLIDMDRVEIKDFNSESMLRGIVDTGTSVIVGPKDMITKMTSQLPSSLDCKNLSQYPTLTFTIGGIEYPLAPEDYILSVSGQCVLGLIGMELPPQLRNAFILGDSFIKKYYTHFDLGNKRVGFSKAKRQ